MERYDVDRTERGILVTLAHTVHNVGMLPGRTADEYNDNAINAAGHKAWCNVGGLQGESFDRVVDANLLAAQYLYAEETGPWEDARPICTDGDIGEGYCINETLPGRLHCELHHR